MKATAARRLHHTAFSTTAIGRSVKPRLQRLPQSPTRSGPVVNLNRPPAIGTPIRVAFTGQGVLLDAVQPGKITLDTGRNLMVASDGALLDHHQLVAGSPQEAQSAASLVLRHADAIAKITFQGGMTIEVHHTPDLDAVTAAAVTVRLLTSGVEALPPTTAAFVDYVRLVDNAAYASEDPSSSLALVIATYFDRIGRMIAEESVQAYNAAHDGEAIAGPWALPQDLKTQLQFYIDHTILNIGVELVNDLLQAGYDPMATDGRLDIDAVPSAWREALVEAQSLIAEDVVCYRAEAVAFEYLDVNLPPREGTGSTSVRLALAHNPESAFFSYLYAEGVAGGIIFKDTQDAELATNYPGARLVMAVNPNQNLSLADIAARLHAAERAKRSANGLPEAPMPGEPAFFKTVANHSMIISHGGRNDQGTIALTAEEIMAVIRGSNGRNI